jgi:UDPglucose 6-dehydrogenase
MTTPKNTEVKNVEQSSASTYFNDAVSYLSDRFSLSTDKSDKSDKSEKKDHKYHIVQIGCGVVGHAYVCAYESAGYKVTCLEASQGLIDKYKETLDIYHVNDDISHVKDVDFIMISVCTPENKEIQTIDMKYLWSTIPNVAKLVSNSRTACVVIRSTIIPTVTEEYKKRLEVLTGFPVDVLFQPEFLRAVSAVEDAIKPWAIVLGRREDMNKDKLDKLKDMYSAFLSKDLIEEMLIEEAEVHKIFHNCFNAMKISYFNQCGRIVESINKKHGTNINMNKIASVLTKTCEGLKNPKYGTKVGHAYYGSCLPKDSACLAKLEKEYDTEGLRLFENVVLVNDEVRKHDKEEVLHGDFHMKYDKFVS